MMILNLIKNILKAFEKEIVEVNENTTIKQIGRDSYLYTYQNEYVLEFYSELLIGEPNRSIDVSSIEKWNPPNEGIEISKKDKEKIVKDICEYFNNNNFSYTLD
tara:strand:+ start:332 stop:643 length:312 start_codon:yes stop_codon:yes gene_type:complete